MIRIKDYKWTIVGVKVSMFAIIVFFWSYYLKKNMASLSEFEWTLHWSSTGLSLGFFFLGYLLFGFLWAPLCYQITGQRLSPVNAFRISALAWMGRYIPGKVWALTAKVYYSITDRKQIAIVGAAISIETLLFEACGLLLAVIIFLFYSNIKIMPSSAPLIAGITLAGVLIFIHPKVFCPVINLILRTLRQTEIDHSPRYSVILLIMLGYTTTFVLWGIAFTIFASSVSPLAFNNLPFLIAVFAMSWVVGFLILFAPAGIGVRESILTMALQPLIPIPAQILIIVVGSRVLITLAEMLCLLLALSVKHMGFQIPAATVLENSDKSNK